MSESWTLPALREATLQWLDKHAWLGGKCTAAQVDKWRFHEFAMLWFPSGSRRVVLAASAWSNLIAILDDVCEDDRSAIAHLRASSNDIPLIQILTSAWNDLRMQLDNEAYLDAAFEDMLDAYEWEHQWRSAKAFPSFDEYDAWRWRSGGLKIYGLILAQHAEVTIDRFTSAPFQTAMQAVGTLACMENDATSTDWDSAHGNPINAGCIANALGGRSLPQWQTIWQQRLSQVLRDDAFVGEGKFVTGLEHIVEGTKEWMRRTGRYTLKVELKDEQ